MGDPGGTGGTPYQGGLVVVRAWGDMKPSERIRKVTNMYLDSYTYQEIADAVGMSLVEVSNCLVDVKKLWLSQGVMDFNEAKSRELARIDRLEFEAWDSFDKSKRPVIIIRGRAARRVGPDPCANDAPDETQLDTRGPGDPKWLAIVSKCIEMRAKIFGFLKDQKITNNNYMHLDWDALVRQPGETPDTLQGMRDHVEERIAAQEAEADEFEQGQEPMRVVNSNGPPRPKPASATPPKPLRPIPKPLSSHPRPFPRPSQ